MIFRKIFSLVLATFLAHARLVSVRSEYARGCMCVLHVYTHIYIYMCVCVCVCVCVYIYIYIYIYIYNFSHHISSVIYSHTSLMSNSTLGRAI